MEFYDEVEKEFRKITKGKFDKKLDPFVYQ